MPSNSLILCRPLLLSPSIFPSIRIFSNESALHIRWPKYWRFSFNMSPSNEHSGLISFRMDWLDLLAVQESSPKPQFKSINSALSFLYFFILFFNFTILYWFAIYQHESAIGIHVFPILNPPPFPSHPSGSSQCTSPKHPVSCIKPGLATRFIYDIIHVSMPFSQIIPPSPSPTESKRLSYTSVSLLQGYCYPCNPLVL